MQLVQWKTTIVHVSKSEKRREEKRREGDTEKEIQRWRNMKEKPVGT